MTADSDLLTFKDWIEFRLVDEDGHPIANQEYEVHLPDGSIREGALNEEGCARLDDIPPGSYRVVYKEAVPTIAETHIEEPTTEDLLAPDEGEVLVDEDGQLDQEMQD